MSTVPEVEVAAGLHVFLKVLGKAPVFLVAFFLLLQVPEVTCIPFYNSLPFAEPAMASQLFLLMTSL